MIDVRTLSSSAPVLGSHAIGHINIEHDIFSNSNRDIVLKNGRMTEIAATIVIPLPADQQTFNAIVNSVGKTRRLTNVLAGIDGDLVITNISANLSSPHLKTLKVEAQSSGEATIATIAYCPPHYTIANLEKDFATAIPGPTVEDIIAMLTTEKP